MKTQTPLRKYVPTIHLNSNNIIEKKSRTTQIPLVDKRTRRILGIYRKLQNKKIQRTTAQPRRPTSCNNAGISSRSRMGTRKT